MNLNRSSQNGKKVICDKSINVQDNLPLYLDESEIEKFMKSGYKQRRLLQKASEKQFPHEGSVAVWDHTALLPSYDDKIFVGEFP